MPSSSSTRGGEDHVKFRAANKRSAMQGLRRYVRTHRRATILSVTAVFMAAAVTAGVILLQSVAVNPSVKTPDVVFAAGDDYSAINTLGYATLTLGSSGTSATMAVSGIPGAADLQLTNLLNVTNNHGSQDYSISLARSASLDTDISNFTVTVKDDVDATVTTWHVKDAASATAFTLPASTTYTIDVRFLVADGVAAGSLDSFDMEFTLSEV